MTKETISVDTCIIGSSINGLWIALELAQKGQKVLLVDKTPIGAEKSSIDVCLSYGCSPKLYGLALKAQKKWFALNKVFGSELNLELRGSLSFALTGQDMDNLSKILTLQKDYNEDLGSFIIKDRQALKALMKSADIGDAVKGGLVSVEDISVEHKECLNLLRREIIQKGVKYWGDDEVTGFEVNNNEIKKVLTKNAEIIAKNVVMATGALSSELLKKLQLNMPIRPARAHITEYTSKAKLPKQIIHYRTKMGDYICKPMLNGRNHLIYTGTDDQMQATWSKNTNQQTVVSSFLEMMRILPILQYVDIQESYAVHLAITPDRLPYFGKTKFYKNLYMNIGYSGSKYLFVPLFAEKLAELIIKNKEDVDIVDLNPDRFAPEGYEINYEEINQNDENSNFNSTEQTAKADTEKKNSPTVEESEDTNISENVEQK